ncbi:MAG: hypothetical protein DHS20C20_20010 [Ardenticatenaceae bacterium]|nr:MAG: hypothetical protein DHS20C20_20010 [Ardenticatenaceae bacterium]
MLGQGVPPYDAARLGGFLHGLSGEISGQARGLLAADLADYIPEAIFTIQT